MAQEMAQRILRGSLRPNRISFISNAQNEASTEVVPTTNFLAGDILLWCNYGFLNATPPPTLVVPTGFTLVQEFIASTNRSRTVTAYKIATGFERGTTLTGMAVGDNAYVYLLQFRTNVATRSLVFRNLNGEASSAAPATQTINVGSGPRPMVVLAHWGAGSGTVSAPTYSITEDANINSGGGTGALKFNCLNDGDDAFPATVTCSGADDGGGNSLVSMYFTCF